MTNLELALDRVKALHTRHSYTASQCVEMVRIAMSLTYAEADQVAQMHRDYLNKQAKPTETKQRKYAVIDVRSLSDGSRVHDVVFFHHDIPRAVRFLCPDEHLAKALWRTLNEIDIEVEQS